MQNIWSAEFRRLKAKAANQEQTKCCHSAIAAIIVSVQCCRLFTFIWRRWDINSRGVEFYRKFQRPSCTWCIILLNDDCTDLVVFYLLRAWLSKTTDVSDNSYIKFAWCQIEFADGSWEASLCRSASHEGFISYSSRKCSPTWGAIQPGIQVLCRSMPPKGDCILLIYLPLLCIK